MTTHLSTLINAEKIALRDLPQHCSAMLRSSEADELERRDSRADDCSETSGDSIQDLISWDDCDEVLEREFERELVEERQRQAALANAEAVALPQRPAVPRPESAASCPRLAFRAARKAKKVLLKPAPPLELLSLAGCAGVALRSLRQS